MEAAMRGSMPALMDDLITDAVSLLLLRSLERALLDLRDGS